MEASNTKKDLRNELFRRFCVDPCPFIFFLTFHYTAESLHQKKSNSNAANPWILIHICSNAPLKMAVTSKVLRVERADDTQILEKSSTFTQAIRMVSHSATMTSCSNYIVL